MKSSSNPSISCAIAAEFGLEPRRLITADPGREYRWELLSADRDLCDAKDSSRPGMGISSSESPAPMPLPPPPALTALEPLPRRPSFGVAARRWRKTGNYFL